MRLTTKDMTRVGIFAALHIAAAVVLRWGGDAVVPFSLVPFMSFLAAFTLGARLGALSLIVYTLLGLMGIPVFAKAPFGGLVYVLQPTFGFVLGFIAAAAIAGQVKIQSFKGAALAVVLSVFSLYFVGLPYFYMIIRFYMSKPITWQWAFSVAVLPYIGLDIVKAILAVLLGANLQKRINKAAG